MYLRTKRFNIRKLKSSDASDIYLKWLYEDQNLKYINRKFNINQKELLVKFIEKVNSGQDINYNNHKITLGNKLVNELKKSYKQKKIKTEFLGIFEKKRNIHIGNIKYDPIDLKNNFAIMGILIGNKNFRGKGTFKEVFLETSKKIYKKYNVKKIYLGLSNQNINARKAYERVGFEVFKKNQNSFFMSVNLPLKS